MGFKKAVRGQAAVLALSAAMCLTIYGSDEVWLDGGTRLLVELQQTISSESAKAGDHFKNQVVEPVVANGKTVVPRGSEVVGVITAVRKESRWRKVGELDFRFDKLKLAGCEAIEISAVPVAVVYANQNSAPLSVFPLMPDSARPAIIPKSRLVGWRGEKLLERGTQLEIVLQKATRIK